MIERWDTLCEASNDLIDAFTVHHLNLYLAAADSIGMPLCDEPRIIVDAACGLGHGFLFLGGLGRYVGLDRSPDAIEEARERYPAGEFGHADFSDRRWLSGLNPDVVVSLETAEHLDDPEDFLRRIALALPAHGQFIFSVPTCLTRDFDPFHLWDLSAELWGSLLTASGFRVERSQTFEIKGSFRDLMALKRTTLREKLRVAMFDLTHPIYLVDRLWNWILHDRFVWQSTLFFCRPAIVKPFVLSHSSLVTEAMNGNR